MPYLGYISADLQLPGTSTSADPQQCLLLVVPDSSYNQLVPLLLGTNVLTAAMTDVKQRYGSRFLQTADLHTPWYITFRCLLLRDKELQKRCNRLAIIKSAEGKTIRIPPNKDVVLQGYMDHELPYHPVCGLLQSTDRAAIPSDLDIAPSLVSYQYRNNSIIPVHISNVTTRTVTVSPNAILCELQPVSVTDIDVPDTYEQDAWNESTFPDTLTDDQLRKARDLLHQFRDVFSTSDTDIGHITAVQHKIELIDETPFKQRHRRIPPALFDEVRTHLQKLLTAGIIRPSHSPWSSNVVLVRKKDNKLRMCVDYRQLNQLTIKDSYALPRSEEILDAFIGGNNYYTVMDMKSGYHQVEVEETHRARTAFTVGPLGFYEFNRLPFGLVNSPATYQRLMEQILGDLHLDICFIYLDDLIIFSETYEEHLERLQMVLQRLREHNLKLSPKKCAFFKDKVKYIGHIVSKDGISPDPDKLEKVINWPRPTTPEEVRRFLGFVGYYRKFVKDFSKKARPLTDLMPAPKKSSKRKPKKPTVTSWVWDKPQEDAFQKLKSQLAMPPVLGYPRYKEPFELHTDASMLGLGAILYQSQEGKKRAIAYASRGLSKTERNYPVH